MAPKLKLAAHLVLLFAVANFVVMSMKQEAAFAENIAPNEENLQQVASDISFTNYQSNAQKFRVNVSNICEKSQMKVTIRINRPFYGLIHVKDKRRKPNCFLEGTGDQTYTLDIHYTQVQTDPNYCGVVSHQQRNPPVITAAAVPRHPNSNQTMVVNNNQQTLSVILVVRLHRSIEFSDDRFFLLSCANRCQRNDCSTPTTSSPNFNSQVQLPNAFRGIATSESIVAPTLKQLGVSSESAKQIVSERCDTLLDLKFHWLVRLCWLLSAILAFMCFLSLCLYLSMQRLKRSETLKRSKSQSVRSIPNQIIYSSQPAKGTAESSSAWSSGTVTTEELNDATSFLIKQQQQQQKQQLFNNSQEKRQPVIGRMSGTFAASNQVRRRRSIGGSARVQTDLADEQPQVLAQYGLENRLNASQRAKSQSQTIIHYNQEQDPFKAVPFQFINSSAYLPQHDDASGQVKTYSITQDTNKQQEAYESNCIETTRYENAPVNQLYQQTVNYPKIVQENISHSKLIENQPSWPAVETNTSNKQTTVCWPTSTRKGTFLPLNEQTNRGLSSENNHQEMNTHSSFNQFDPNNSRQLIDLIQHKHRQQILQANKAAALIQRPEQKSYSEQYQGQQQQQQPINIQQQRSNQTTIQGRIWK